MKCHICDRDMSDTEIQYIPGTKTFDCCGTCLTIAMEAAYCDGFVKEDPLELEPEIETKYGNGAVPVLDAGVFSSQLDNDATLWCRTGGYD